MNNMKKSVGIGIMLIIIALVVISITTYEDNSVSDVTTEIRQDNVTEPRVIVVQLKENMGVEESVP